MNSNKKKANGHLSWPRLSTISIYKEAPQKIFSSDDCKFDLSDALTANLRMGEKKTAFVGVATRSSVSEIWDETYLQDIEARMRYLFEFDGFGLDITRVNDESEPWFVHEFIWKLDFWIMTGYAEFNEDILKKAEDADMDDDSLYDRAVTIVLSNNKASFSVLQRHLRVGHNRAARLLEMMERRNVVSQIQSNGTRKIMAQSTNFTAQSSTPSHHGEITKETGNKNPTCFLYLDDLRSPPAGATLCRTAEEAIALIHSGVVTHISFDHDLGTDLTGYDVAKEIEQLVAEGRIRLPNWRIHSANPVGRRNIEAAMQSAVRFEKRSLQQE